MKNAYLFVVVLIIIPSLLFLLNSCSREYSYEGGRQPDSIVVVLPSVAKYTLAGSPNDCSNPIIRGTYTAGTHLTNTHTVTITVNVTSPGSYNLKTDTINGVSFSASGDFTNTGNQTVLLQGAGRPDNPGLFSFTPQIDSSHCSFDISVQNSEPVATYVLESGGNSQASCIGTVAGTYKTQTALTAANQASISVYVANVGNYTVQTKKVNGMMFSYTGTFTTIGSQYITLYGSGTPLAAGTFYLVPQIVGPHPLGGQSCGINVTVQ